MDNAPVNEPWHGTNGGYNNHRCRCLDCCRAHTEAAIRGRAIRLSRIAELPAEKHGNLSTYVNWGCRCDLCVDGARAYWRANWHAKKAARS